MEEIKISTIIPVFNTEKYLEQCLNSLILQTYKNIEIICINDGSTDNSLSILENYAKQDDRIKIITKENKGFASARNEGLKHITGDWIAFLDSDDWLKNDCYEKFYQAAKENLFDIYMFNGVSFADDIKNNEDKNLFEFFNKDLWNKKNNELCTYKDCKNIFQGNMGVYNKIYKKEFFFDSNLKFKKGFAEDERFWIEALIKAKSIYITDEVYYHYRQRKDSVMHTLKENVFEMFDTYNSIKEILKENNIFDMAKYALLQYKFNQFAWGFFSANEKIREDFYKKAKEDLTQEIKSGFILDIVENLQNHQLLFGFLNLNCDEFYKKFEKCVQK